MGGMDGFGIASTITSAMAPYQSHRDAMIRQHDAQGFDMQMFSNRYRMQVEDLKNAGLNPMLAYTQGPGSAPASPIGQGANFDTDPVGKGVATTVQRKIASAQEANINADSAKKIQEAATGSAQEKLYDAQRLVQGGMLPLLAAQTSNFAASADQARSTIEKIRAEIPQVQAHAEMLKSQSEKNRSDIKLNQNLIETNAYLTNLRMMEAELTMQRASKIKQEMAIDQPKAYAAGLSSARGGAIAENIGKIGKSAMSFLSPFNTGN